MKSDHRNKVDSETLEFLNTIESTFSERERETAIYHLAASENRDAGRILINTFDLCMWRETKKTIIRAIGPMRLFRTTEFLIKLAGYTEDYPLAAEAILALGNTEDPLAGEYLLGILQDQEHPLAREAIISLTTLTEFPSQDGLIAVLPQYADSPSVLQYLILAIGRKGNHASWSLIEKYLSHDHSAVQNASLIAAANAGGDEALKSLQAQDTRYRFFADQLKTLVEERIVLRQSHSVEDAIAKLNEAETDNARKNALKFLTEFDPKEGFEAFQLLGTKLSPGVECRVRLALFDRDRLKDDLQFVLKHWKEVDWSTAACLLRRHMEAHDAENIVEQIPDEVLLDLMFRIKIRDSFAILEKLYNKSDNGRIKVINAAIAQTMMAGSNQTAGIEFLLGRLKVETEPGLKARLIRGLGQVNYYEPSFLIELNSQLKKPDYGFESVYACLANLSDQEAAAIILRRLKKIGSDPDRTDETGSAIEALAQCAKKVKIEAVPQIIIPKGHEHAMLAVLGTTQGEGYESFILECLKAQDFQSRILAIGAAKYNFNGQIIDMLIESLNDTNRCVQGRTVDSLCAIPNLNAHTKLMTWASTTANSPEMFNKVFRGITPEPGQTYDSIITMIESLATNHEIVSTNQETKEAAKNMATNLSVAKKPLKKELANLEHSLDGFLESALPGFSTFSEMIKTVIRNAELTYRHSDIFDDRVDKSTMVVEYVKSIDLLLQEKIGSQLFLNTSSNLLSRMQSRVIQLGLDQDLKAAQLVKDLQCAQQFPVEDFPAHKLSSLSQEILNGRITRDQYKTIDGLRSWALLLLIFGRSFKYRKQDILPVFDLQSASNPVICTVAAQMNALQEVRNQAAHRGTLLVLSKLEDIRSHCFGILQALQNAL